MLLVADVEALESDNLSLNILPVCLDDAVQLLRSAACDVDLGSVDGQSLGDHQANATATTSDEGDATLEVEETVAVEVGMTGCGCALGSHCGCLDARYRCGSDGVVC